MAALGSLEGFPCSYFRRSRVPLGASSRVILTRFSALWVTPSLQFCFRKTHLSSISPGIRSTEKSRTNFHILPSFPRRSFQSSDNKTSNSLFWCSCDFPSKFGGDLRFLEFYCSEKKKEIVFNRSHIKSYGASGQNTWKRGECESSKRERPRYAQSFSLDDGGIIILALEALCISA